MDDPQNDFQIQRIINDPLLCTDIHSHHIISELKRQNLSDAESDFLLEHGPVVQQKIKDEQIKQINVWLE